MKIIIKKTYSERLANRLSKKTRIRKKVAGTLIRPRLCIYRSLNNIYAQIIDDVSQKTLFQASSLEISSKVSLKQKAVEVGKLIAKKALENKVENVVFDRNGFIYHGRVKSLADSARENGLKF
ncbi:MAG: 50S ribosomal protein L18 [Bdellovibrionaceae bacterium]|nr:50S ribosomal protein L18 [Pseudobdellovibrionaceae bacterium]